MSSTAAGAILAIFIVSLVGTILGITSSKKIQDDDADTLFENLGYKKLIDNDIEIIYVQKNYEQDEWYTYYIKFAKKTQWLEKYYEDYDDVRYVVFINMQELKAINAKVKELGWNDE